VDVVRDVIKIVNDIRSKALSHLQFKVLLDEMDAQYGDVLYHQEVRWLSRGKVLRRFFDLRDEIRAFQESKIGSIQEPMDKKWLSDLAFLVDVTELLNVLNVQFQRKDQIITQLFFITSDYTSPRNRAKNFSFRVKRIKQFQRRSLHNSPIHRETSYSSTGANFAWSLSFINTASMLEITCSLSFKLKAYE